MRAVILSGGRGTRLHPFTVAFPKPLMPLDDMPIIEIVLRQLRRDGFDHITLAVGHLAELTMAFLEDGSRLDLRIDYFREDQPLGTAGPLRMIDDLPDTFLVMNGDLLTTLDFARLMREHTASPADMTIATQRREVKIDFGVLETDGDGMLIGYSEKPAIGFNVSMGAYVLDRAALDYIPHGEYFDMPDLIRCMIGKHSLHTYRHDGLWLDIGRHDDYEEAQRQFAENRAAFLPDPS